jgi:hypothetical protein
MRVILEVQSIRRGDALCFSEVTRLRALNGSVYAYVDPPTFF